MPNRYRNCHRFLSLHLQNLKKAHPKDVVICIEVTSQAPRQRLLMVTFAIKKKHDNAKMAPTHAGHQT